MRWIFEKKTIVVYVGVLFFIYWGLFTNFIVFFQTCPGTCLRVSFFVTWGRKCSKVLSKGFLGVSQSRSKSSPTPPPPLPGVVFGTPEWPFHHPLEVLGAFYELVGSKNQVSGCRNHVPTRRFVVKKYFWDCKLYVSKLYFLKEV